MLIQKIYADFMKRDDEGCLILICIGTRNDLAKYNIELKEGMTLLFYTDDLDDDGNRDDLLVEGRVTYNNDINAWVAEADDTIINESELKNESNKYLLEKYGL